MAKKLLSLVLMLICVFMANSQQPLPLNPEVRHGVLPNGLTYYILHNEQPKNRANFYIAQKVGSALETPEQYGLAHFLEHMAFNGTKHYPGDSMLRYLESKGIRFGADINAYTDYEETVYNIDNVPTDNALLMDSVLLALRDWSCDLLLEDAEIDAERKVIQEEWRMRNDPSFRFRSAMAPKIFSEPQYQLTPIGTMEVVMNFPYKALRDYYHKWYRPDQQGIIVVGDFNTDDMEKKVVEMFSDIPMPENAAPREYVRVSDNDKPLFFAFEDPELKNARVDFQIKYDKIPLEYQNTDVAFANSMMQNITADMINTRLYEHTLDADCKYASAGVYFDDMYPSKTKGIFNVAVIAKDDELGGFEDAFQTVVRACRTGFTQSELDRAIDNLKSSYDKRFNERNNTNNSILAKELINAFNDNVPAMGIEAERNFFNNLMAHIPLAAYNQALSKMITPNNQVILIQQQKKEDKVLPTEQETLEIVNNVLDRQYEAYVDEALAEPLIAQLPSKGIIVKIEEGRFGTTEIVLSNGVKVIVKPTEYKDDEILFQAFRKGGKAAYSLDDAANILMLGDAVSLSNVGPFDNVASLPSSKKEVRKVIAPVNTADGEVIDNFTVQMAAPADWLYGLYSGTNVPNTIQDQVKTSLVGDIVKILYTETLREKEGGVYTPMVYSYYDINNSKWNLVYFLQTNKEQSARMLQLADEIFINLLKNGASADQFNRVRGALLSQFENAIRTNSYWHDNIRLYELLGIDLITEHRSAIENLTLEDFNDFMRKLYDGKNRIQVNMHGVAIAN